VITTAEDTLAAVRRLSEVLETLEEA